MSVALVGCMRLTFQGAPCRLPLKYPGTKPPYPARGPLLNFSTLGRKSLGSASGILARALSVVEMLSA